MTPQTHTPMPITSLADLQARRAALRERTTKQEQRIAQLWHTLTRPDTERPATAAGRAIALTSTAVNVADGVLLGWKLYRRFCAKPAKKERRKWWAVW